VQINRNTIGDVACSRPVEQWDTRQLVLGRSESINAALSRQLSRLDTWHGFIHHGYQDFHIFLSTTLPDLQFLSWLSFLRLPLSGFDSEVLSIPRRQ
jgi:hypothetical protein